MGFHSSLPCHRRHSPAVLGIFIQTQVWPYSDPHHGDDGHLDFAASPPEPAFEALRERALQCRGAEVRALKEAVPIPMEIVMAWELGAAQSDPLLANGHHGKRKYAI